MVFIPAVTEVDDVASYITLENEAENLARVCIGHDDETGTIYSVFVSLNVRAVDRAQREITFMVVESPPDEQDNWCNDGLQTKRFLAPEHRKTALACICSVLQAMVEQTDAEVLYMMTVTPNLPKNALKKYEIICDSMRAIGFQAGRDSSYYGTEVWLMKRISDGT